MAVVANPPPRQVSATIAKNPPADGYNWRKYGQKHVKNSKFPRNYYKCTHPNCKVTKKIEYSTEGHVAEIIYKGSHSHPKANPSCEQMAVNDYNSRKWNEDDQYMDTVELSSSARSACQPKYTIAIESCREVFDDGFRWRKYGQKVVKGNSNPRSYYRCTHPECTVRKHIERAPNDTKIVLTTYEGHHNHEIPAARNSSLHHNQGCNNMVVEARVEAPTMANQERVQGQGHGGLGMP
ncbi:putative WRKY transcription factor 3 [Curcuma longa]|uniref:putative WRKY transcription factor 3 n=1 Tax=Curcuma longa TaxID=136217 RepID=UPI003D9F073E